MHTAYLVHQFDPADNECRDLSKVAFATLYNNYFKPEKDEVNLFQHSSSVKNNFPCILVSIDQSSSATVNGRCCGSARAPKKHKAHRICC